MNQENLKLFVMMAERHLEQSVMLITMSKLFASRLKNIEDITALLAKAENMPDSDEKQALMRKLESLTSSDDMRKIQQSLTDVLAFAESGHEKCEHLLSVLKKSLGN